MALDGKAKITLRGGAELVKMAAAAAVALFGYGRFIGTNEARITSVESTVTTIAKRADSIEAEQKAAREELQRLAKSLDEHLREANGMIREFTDFKATSTAHQEEILHRLERVERKIDRIGDAR